MIVFEPDLRHRVLIEAGAGTGKTWTIAGLYLRLIVEAGYGVDQILVVTFTNAATAELRERLRARLVEIRRALVSGQAGEDAFAQQLLARIADRDQALKRLTRAIRSFDEAAVFTIHGFCQRLLAETALQSGIGFERELMGDQSELVASLVDDFWRRRFYGEVDEQTLAALEQGGLSPESLRDDIGRWVGSDWLDIHPVESADCEGCLERLQRQKAALTRMFDASREEIDRLFKAAMGPDGALKGNIYRPANFPERFQALEDYLAGDELLALPEKSELFTPEKLASSTRKNRETPTHPFFEAWAAFLDLRQAFDQWAIGFCARLRIEMLEEVREKLAALKAESGQLSYDDLLSLLHKALVGPGGEALARAARERYPVALIDEFQDTDPLQYEIFNRIYPGERPLFFVGDPKQAIYAFRGADIHTYLTAAQGVECRLDLKENFRSSTDMVRAVNTLFERCDNPFFEKAIRYRSVTAGRGEAQQQAAPSGLGALRIWHDYEREKPAAKGEIGPRIVAAVGDEIASLLSRAEAPENRIDGRPLCGGDIAVLVRTHVEAISIREALTRRGVGCVLQTQESVYQSPEAEALALTMRAMLPGASDAEQRAALATVLFDPGATTLAQMLEDDALRDQWAERFFRWQTLWRERGFMAAMRAWLSETEAYVHLLDQPGGERRLTNLLHLIELLHREATAQRLGEEALLHWFLRQRDRREDNEAAQLRLESDDNLVKIVTVHKSKGLQYPIVYCPFLWAGAPDGRKGVDRGKPFSVHDPEQDNKPLLVMDCAAPQRLEALRHEETYQENIRLLYVALTRAEFHCTVVTGRFRDMEKSALAWLLHGGCRAGAAQSWTEAVAAIKRESPESLMADLEALAQASQGAISLCALPPERDLIRLPRTSAAGLAAPRRFTRQLPARRRIASYTALTSGQDAEQPDYDRGRQPGADTASPFRGAEAGSCLHWILEHLDFRHPVAEQRETVVEPGLRRHGFSERLADDTASWMQRVIDTPLDDGQLTLAGIERCRRLDEMEFHYPVPRLDSRGLKALLKRHFSAPVFRQAIARLKIGALNGYLKGFVDLVFEHQGRYFLADYKSNWLGEEIADYGPDALAAEMAESHYYLQATIYLLALHRFLRLRLPDYDYETHFGGVYYLFLRGMTPRTGSANGVWFDRPPQAFVEALDALIGDRGGQ